MDQPEPLNNPIRLLTILGIMLLPVLAYLLMASSQALVKVLMGIACAVCVLGLLVASLNMLKKNYPAFGQVLIIGGSVIWFPFIVMKYVIGMDIKASVMLFLIPHLLFMFLGVYYKRIKPRREQRS